MKSYLCNLLLAFALVGLFAATLLGQDSLVMVKDFSGFPNPYASPANVIGVENALYFFLDDGLTGFQLWKSDGMPAGTMPVKIVPNGTEGFRMAKMGVFYDRLLFAAEGATPYGRELWMSDGTEPGTVLLKFFYYGPSSVSNPVYFVAAGGNAFFNGKDTAAGQELWKTDGTPSGTLLVKDILVGSSSSGPYELTVVGDTVFFNATETSSGRELWRTDGTEAGTYVVKDIRPGSASSYPSYLVAIGKTLYFVASDDLHGRELWKTDGTTTGTTIVKDIRPGTPSGVGTTIDLSRKPLTMMDGILYFQASDGAHGYELWRSDGTEAGTSMLKDIRAGAASSQDSTVYQWLQPSYATVNGTLFFLANDGVHGTELWKTDGTEGGTVLVKDIYPGARPNSPGSVGDYPSRLTSANGMLYFVGNDSVHGEELWKSDGTPEGTVRAFPGQISYPGGFTIAGGTLYIVGGRALYRVAPGLTDVDSHDGALPLEATLSQNYPNPFNPSTTIKYELPKASRVRLSVHDILGREVSVLVNDKKSAGVHEVKFDASALSTGVYFYRLQAGDYTQTKRLLLLR